MNRIFMPALSIYALMACSPVNEGTEAPAADEGVAAPETEADAPVADAKPVKEPKPARQAQNGVTLPAEGSKTRRIWDIADEISATTGRPALRGEVLEQSRAESMSDGTAGTQYGRWATYHNVTREDLTKVRETIREENKPVATEPAGEETAAEAPAADAAAAE